MYNDKCLEGIGILKQLTQLNLFYVNLSNEGMRKLKDLALVSLQIVGGIFEDDGLTYLPNTLNSLRLSRIKDITNAGLLFLPSTLERVGTCSRRFPSVTTCALIYGGYLRCRVDQDSQYHC